MNIKKNTFKILAIQFLLITNIAVLNCQNGDPLINRLTTDSLTLNDIIKQVLIGHPAIKGAEEALNNADARINFSKSGYYPDADITANYSIIGPVTKLEIPNMGTFQLFPQNNYSASLNLRQTIYDFGRTSKSISLENENKSFTEQTIKQVKQKMVLTAINNFYTLLYLQEAILIKNQQLQTLKEHLDFVEKMLATGSATEYQVLATKVRISVIEGQELDLQSALNAQMAVLNSLLGISGSQFHKVKKELSVKVPVVSEDSLLSYAYNNRDEILLSERKTSLAELRYGFVNTQNKPVISFLASGGAKNGYIPNLERMLPNYIVGVGMRIPIFDGMKTKYNLLQAKSSINSLSFETEVLKRNVSNEVVEAETNMKTAGKKIKQFELQLIQALKAYFLAETSFKSGVITNLDLLDSDNAVSESRLMLLKAKIDYTASVYRLKAALGERLY
jgi:outer membrane protein